MKMNKVKVLAILVIVEAIVIVLIITRGFHVVVKVSPAAYSPLETALDYEVSDKKFEELVKEYSKWISYRLPSPNSPSILSDCVIMNRTNYVRILIANGADVDEAVKSMKKIGATNAVNLLQQVQLESKSGMTNSF
jgi:hypothetical protein